jgi:predicted ATPase
LQLVANTGERWYEAELWRIKGTLTLQSQVSLRQVSNETQPSPGRVKNKSKTSQGQAADKSAITDSRSLNPDPQFEAEACFLKAIDIARKQQAKSLELRAVMSLVRLRQQQAALSASRTTHREARRRLDDAHQMLADMYGWFREGFDTADLKEAKALLAELA